MNNKVAIAPNVIAHQDASPTGAQRLARIILPAVEFGFKYGFSALALVCVPPVGLLMFAGLVQK